MARHTKAYLETVIASKDAEIMDLNTQLVAARQRVAQLEAASMALQNDVRHISDRRRMMDRCKELASQGVPCKIHRGVLVHSITHAPL